MRKNKFIAPFPLFVLIFSLLFPFISYAAVSVESFTCNGQSGTVVVENSATFSCQASIKNEDTQNSANIGSVTLLVNSNWAEQTSYTGTGFSTTITAGASTTATFSGIKSVTPGATNKFQSIQLDSSTDTLVANTNVNAIIIKSITVSSSSSSIAQGSEFDVSATVIAGGDIGGVTLTWSGSGGCSLSSGHMASKSLGSLSHNTESTRTWRIAQGSSDCVNTITALGTSSSVTTSKSKSITVSVSGGGSSGSTSTTTTGGGGGGGGGGGVSANVTKENQTFSVITPGAASIRKFTSNELGVKEISIEVHNPANNVTITVTKLAGQPASVAKAVTGTAYKYLDIDAKNLGDNNIKTAKIRFSVSKSWLTENNFNANEISLRRFSSGSWEKLITSLLTEGPLEADYEAATPGFSTFVIVGEKTVTQTVTQPSGPTAVCGNNVREGGEECDGSDIAGQSCASMNLIGGTLKCAANCKFDAGACVIQLPPGFRPPGTGVPQLPVSTEVLYAILALIIIVIAGYFHYHHSPRKKVYNYKP